MTTEYKKTIPKGEFKAKMFEYLRLVEETDAPILVTDYGKPAVVIYPYREKQSVEELFSQYRGKLKVKGDLLESENDEWGELA
jgi:prevent-host-death family protein